MGIETDNNRRSQRLFGRFESLRTGATPYQRFVSLPYRNRSTVKTLAHRSGLSTSQRDHIDISELDSVQTLQLNSDINLERPPLSTERVDNMAEVENRFSDIETDVTELRTDVTSLKTDVTAINGKLDNLIESMTRLSTNVPQAPNTPPENGLQSNSPSGRMNSTDSETTQGHVGQRASHKQAQRQSPHNRAETHDPSHNAASSAPYQRSTRHLSPEEFLQREMERDRFEYSNVGKYIYASDFSSSRIFHKPYMYLYREGVSTIKQKVEARQSINVTEYIDATLALLADNRAYHREDFVDMMDHLRKVTRDALERPWHAVRRWSQFVWDSIESGAFTWADRDIIQEERVRMCLTSSSIGLTNGNHQGSQNNWSKKQNGAQEVICRSFNTRMGCNFRDSHTEGQVFALHICTYCDSLGRSCAHSVRECERRLAHTRNDNGPYNPRNRFAQNNQQQNHQNQQFNQYPQVSKNGY